MIYLYTHTRRKYMHSEMVFYTYNKNIILDILVYKPKQVLYQQLYCKFNNFLKLTQKTLRNLVY